MGTRSLDPTASPTRVPVILLMGPTAAGKSAAARALAQRWPVEIINVDSATIYRQMDIGTAKPDADERRAVRHHLLDIRDPAQSYSVAEFRQDALELITAIRQRGHLPVLAGGTMMYFHVLQHGLADLPPADARLRTELAERAEREGWPALHAWLEQLDPATAARLAPNDSQRIQRALEVCLITGRPMSAALAQTPRAHNNNELSRDNTITLSLEPSDRSALHQRIAQRFDAMLAAGLVTEVRALYERGDLHPGLPSIRCVGYRQLWPLVAGESSLPEARERAIAATRQLAKRQITWLRGRRERQVIDCLRPDAAELVVDACYTALAARADWASSWA